MFGAEPETSLELPAEMERIREACVVSDFLDQPIGQGKLGGGYIQSDALGLLHGAAAHLGLKIGKKARGGHVCQFRHLGDGKGRGEIIFQVRKQWSKPLPGFQQL